MEQSTLYLHECQCKNVIGSQIIGSFFFFTEGCDLCNIAAMLSITHDPTCILSSGLYLFLPVHQEKAKTPSFLKPFPSLSFSHTHLHCLHWHALSHSFCLIGSRLLPVTVQSEFFHAWSCLMTFCNICVGVWHMYEFPVNSNPTPLKQRWLGITIIELSGRLTAAEEHQIVKCYFYSLTQ